MSRPCNYEIEAKVLAESIASARLSNVSQVLELCWTKMHALKFQRSHCLIRTGKQDPNCDDCEAINLGNLSREFPKLDDPQINQLPYHRWSLSRILRTIKEIVHVDLMDQALAPGFIKKHMDCDVSHQLIELSEALAAKVEGLYLKS